MINVMIVDDTRLFREGIKHMLEQNSDIKVVASAANGKEAIDLCERFLPDAILMDIVMPISDGFEATRLIKEKHSSIKIIILTTSSDNDNLTTAMMNGADGYVLKEASLDELILAIKSVVAGLSIFDQEVYKKFASNLNSAAKESPSAKSAYEGILSERELSVIQLVASGLSNREIASRLFIAEGRVKNIITTILNKLNMKDRTQLAVFAVKNNLA